jgi:hypothetical protein
MSQIWGYEWKISQMWAQAVQPGVGSELTALPELPTSICNLSPHKQSMWPFSALTPRHRLHCPNRRPAHQKSCSSAQGRQAAGRHLLQPRPAPPQLRPPPQLPLPPAHPQLRPPHRPRCLRPLQPLRLPPSPDRHQSGQPAPAAPARYPSLARCLPARSPPRLRPKPREQLSHHRHWHPPGRRHCRRRSWRGRPLGRALAVAAETSGPARPLPLHLPPRPPHDPGRRRPPAVALGLGPGPGTHTYACWGWVGRS